MSKAYPRISLKIDLKKIDQSHAFKGAKGTYCDMTLMENADGPDQYGYDGLVSQSVSKEARQKGIKGPIIGNWKYIDTNRESAPQQPRGHSSSPPLDSYAQPPKKPVFRAPPTPEPDLDADMDDIQF